MANVVVPSADFYIDLVVLAFLEQVHPRFGLFTGKCVNIRLIFFSMRAGGLDFRSGLIWMSVALPRPLSANFTGDFIDH
jgi:hypothetical protein